MTKDLPSPELLRKLLRYEPETGKLFWRERTPDMFDDGLRTASQRTAAWNTNYKNKEAFKLTDKDGYFCGTIFSQRYYAHRIAWSIFYGKPLSMQIDHINGNKADNRIANLRACRDYENYWNCAARKNNKSKLKGVSFHKASGLWRSEISAKGVKHYLGYYRTAEEAHNAYCEASLKLHGEFSNTGVE